MAKHTRFTNDQLWKRLNLRYQNPIQGAECPRQITLRLWKAPIAFCAQEPDGTIFWKDIAGDPHDILQMYSLKILLLFGLYWKPPSLRIAPGFTGPHSEALPGPRNRMKLGIIIVKKAEFLEFICHSIKGFPEQNLPGVLFHRWRSTPPLRPFHTQQWFFLFTLETLGWGMGEGFRNDRRGSKWSILSVPLGNKTPFEYWFWWKEWILEKKFPLKPEGHRTQKFERLLTLPLKNGLEPQKRAHSPQGTVAIRRRQKPKAEAEAATSRRRLAVGSFNLYRPTWMSIWKSIITKAPIRERVVREELPWKPLRTGRDFSKKRIWINT